MFFFVTETPDHSKDLCGWPTSGKQWAEFCDRKFVASISGFERGESLVILPLSKQGLLGCILFIRCLFQVDRKVPNIFMDEPTNLSTSLCNMQNFVTADTTEAFLGVADVSVFSNSTM